MSTAPVELLSRLRITPVLCDIGASGGPPAIWKPIAPFSTYIGFDPDLRDMQETFGGEYGRSIIINQAVAADPAEDETAFFLTRSPYCSSTLEPDMQSLSNYLFADLFAVEQQTTAAATTLEKVLERLSLDHIDWMKVDSQGTDLRIFESLEDATRSRLLVLDVEPGLIDAYRGEDLFVDAHRSLTSQGFWLADLNIGSTVRMGTETFRSAALFEGSGIEEERARQVLLSSLKESPGWCEARYFRTIDALNENPNGQDYFLAWIFAMLDDQLGFALDLCFAYEKALGADDTSVLMREETTSVIRRACKRPLVASAIASHLPEGAKNIIRRARKTRFFRRGKT